MFSSHFRTVLRTHQRVFHHLRKETLKKAFEEVETQVGPLENWVRVLQSRDQSAQKQIFALTGAHWEAAGRRENASIRETQLAVINAQVAAAQTKFTQENRIESPELAEKKFTAYSKVLRALLERDGPKFLTNEEPGFSWVPRGPGDTVDEILKEVGKVKSLGFRRALVLIPGKTTPLIFYGAQGNGKTSANDQVANVLISAEGSYYPPSNILFLNPSLEAFPSPTSDIPENDERTSFFYIPGVLSMLSGVPFKELMEFNVLLTSNLLRLWCLARGGDEYEPILLVVRADEFHRSPLASRALIRLACDFTMHSNGSFRPIDVMLTLSGSSSDIRLREQRDLGPSIVVPRYELVPVVADPAFGLEILKQAVQKSYHTPLSSLPPLVQHALKRVAFTLGGHPLSLGYLEVLSANKLPTNTEDLETVMEWSQQIYLQIKGKVMGPYAPAKLLQSLEFDQMLRVMTYAHSRTPLHWLSLYGHDSRHHLDSGLLAATKDSNGEFVLSLSWLMLHIFSQGLKVSKSPDGPTLPLFPTCIFDKPIAQLPGESSYLDELFSSSFCAQNGKFERTAMAALQLSFFSKVLQACDNGKNSVESISIAGLRGLPGFVHSHLWTSIQKFPVRRPRQSSSTSTGSHSQNTSNPTFLDELYSNVQKNACFSLASTDDINNPLFDFFPQCANQPEQFERVKQLVLEGSLKAPVHFPLRAEHALIDAVTLFPPCEESSVLLLSSITGSEQLEFDMSSEFDFVKDLLLKKLGKLFLAMHLFRTGLGRSGSNVSDGPKIEVVGELVTDRIVLGLLEPSEAQYHFPKKFYTSNESMKPLIDFIESERKQRTDLYDLLFEKKTVQEWEKLCVDLVSDAAKDDDMFQSLLPATSEKVSFAQFLTLHPSLLFVDASNYENAFGLFSGPGLARLYQVSDQWVNSPPESK